MKHALSTLLILLSLSFSSTTLNAFGFPEFSFCPLGGPGGWMNRMSNERSSYYNYAQPYSTQTLIPYFSPQAYSGAPQHMTPTTMVPAMPPGNYQR